MKKALLLAQKASDMGEVPVGAIIVRNGEIIAQAFNQKESKNIPTAHAEIIAIEAAAQTLGHWRLIDCELFVTLEPCLMCAGAIIQARLKRVVFGALDPKAGAVQSLFQTLSDSRLNHRPQVTYGVLAEECGQLLSQFFKNKRKPKND